MSKGKAKTASKNNPTTRETARKFYHNGKEVKPTKIVTLTRSVLGAEDEEGNVVYDAAGAVVPWGVISKNRAS